MLAQTMEIASSPNSITPYSLELSSVEINADAIANLQKSWPATYETLTEELGTERLEQLASTDPHIMAHMLATGELLGRAMRKNKKAERVQYLGRLVGGLHDIGKLTRPDIRRRTSSGDVFQPYERSWVRTEHCLEGGRYIGALILDKQQRGEPSRALQYARLGAVLHHSPLPSPTEYAQYEPGLALAFGLVDTLRAVDPLHAIGFDPHRSYVRKALGELNREDIYWLVGKERGRGYDEPPRLGRRPLGLSKFVATTLQIRPPKPPAAN